MPKKSAAALAVAQSDSGPTVGRLPPNPSADLSDAEKSVWRRVVRSIPRDYLTEAQDGVLRDLCRHEVRADMLADAINAFELDPQDWESVKALDKLTLMATREGAAALACLRALRLTNQSRLHRETAGNAKHGRRPDIDWSA